MLHHFYPRSPCGERLIIISHKSAPVIFLSTLSLRRATDRRGGSRGTFIDFYPRSPCGERRGSQQLSARPTTYFYPRSPCGERHTYTRTQSASLVISIHALLAESDMNPMISLNTCRLFLSTLSLRRATANGGVLSNSFINFYPRSPCGERPGILVIAKQCRDFYPRSPCGERLRYRFLFLLFL